MRGIFIYDREHKISQYTVDTIFILDGSVTSFLNAFATLDLFSKISGLQVNSATHKKCMIWLKNYLLKLSIVLNGNQTKSNECVLLGIHFEKIPDLNYDIQSPKITVILKNW